MGVDFLEKTRRSYDKFIDRKRAELATPDFFTREPINKPRSLVFKMSDGADLTSGETVIVESSQNGIVATKNFCEVARASKASQNTKEKIAKGGGVALGTVRRINPMSQTIEVDLK